MNKSKLPKDYLYMEGSFEGWGQFFPNPLPPKIAHKVLKSVFDIVMVWKKIVPSWNMMQIKISVNLTYFAGL